jgi:hypothetical protein
MDQHDALEPIIIRSGKLFLKPTTLYPWEQIINGVKRKDGATISAVGSNTWCDFVKRDEQKVAADLIFKEYFMQEKVNIVHKLSRVTDTYQLDLLGDKICSEILKILCVNIKPEIFKSYNTIRMPVDLYFENLVAMSQELKKEREILVPYLYVPLSNPILSSPYCFTNCELKKNSLDRSSTNKEVMAKDQYDGLQRILKQRANRISQLSGVKFYPIYFDLFWKNKYMNEGGNLFEIVILEEDE